MPFATATTLQTIAIFLGAVATSLGVLVALFYPGYLERKRRPRLSIRPFDPTQGDGTVIDTDPSDASAWARIRIANAPGRDAAREVEVVLERIEPIHTEAERRAWLGCKGDLAVLSGNPLKWADRARTITLDIPSGSVRRFDLLHIRTCSPNRRLPGGSLAVPMRLALQEVPEQGQHLLSDLAYRAAISVTARNCEPLMENVVIKFGGMWIGGPEIWTDPQGVSIVLGDAVVQ